MDTYGAAGHVRDAVMDHLHDSPVQWHTTRAIADATGAPMVSVHAALGTLYANRKVERRPVGLRWEWTLSP